MSLKHDVLIDLIVVCVKGRCETLHNLAPLFRRMGTTQKTLLLQDNKK